MIIETLLSVLFNLLDFLLFFKIPDLPETALEYVNQFFDYLVAGAGILSNYAPLTYLFTLFSIILVVDAAILVYHFVMWIIRKIPMLGMS